LSASPVRVAVVGCGWWATTSHLPAIVGDADAELVGLVDADEDRLRRAADAFGGPATFLSASRMIEAVHPEAVVIAVPPADHYAIAREALLSGAHVLVEKPMVLSPREGRELVDLAKANGRALVVGYPYHYNAQARLLRSLLGEGRIGRLELVTVLFASVVRELYAGRPHVYREAFGFGLTEPLPSSYGDPARVGGGQGQTQVTHAAALLLWLTGMSVDSVSAFTASSGLPVDLSDAIAVRFTSDVVGVIASTGGVVHERPEILEYRFFGSEGHILWDVYGESGSISTRSGVSAIEELEPTGGYPMGAPVRNLIDIARDRDVNHSPGELGLSVVELLDAMYRSADGGGSVRVQGDLGGPK
jgi:predicted dehydrogenase